MGLLWLPVRRSWRLNERHYGALQGLNKAQTAERYGEAQVKVKSVGPPDEVASGRLTLKSAGKAVGSVHYALAVGKSKTLTVKLNKAGKLALAAGGTLTVVASAVTTGAKAVTATLKLEG